MRKYIVLVLVLGLASAARLAAQTHDIEIRSISPAAGSRAAINIATPVTIEARNRGTSNEQNVKVVITARDTAGPLAYADSTTVSSWTAGEIKDITLKDFTPYNNTRYLVTAFVYVEGDQVRSNDTLTTRWTVGYEYDIAARGVTSPAPYAELPQKVYFSLIGTFINQSGVVDVYDVPVRIRIQSSATAALVFQSDSIAREVYIDSPAVAVRFPSRVGNYDVRKLPPGDYRIAAIARYPTDGDRTNDTAYSEFTILPNRLARDVGIDTVLSPLRNVVVQEGTSIAPTMRFSNVGESNESAVVLRAVLLDRNKHIIYQDTAIVALNSGQSVVHVFRSVTPSAVGKYAVLFSATIPSDGYAYNDTLSTTFYYGEKYAYRITTIASPSADTTLYVEDPRNIVATIEWRGSIGTTPGSIAYAELYDRSTNALLRRDRGSCGVLTLDSPFFECRFVDTLSARYDTGAMRLAIVVPYYDTLYRDFKITRGRHLAVDTIMSPRPHIESATCPVHARLHNDGARRFDSVRVWVNITRPYTNGYSESQLFYHVDPYDSLDLVLRDFTAPSEGTYRLSVYWYDLGYRDEAYALIDSPFVYQRANVSEHPEGRTSWFDAARSILHVPHATNSITVIDLLGRDVTDSVPRVNDTAIDFSMLPHGFYFIRLTINASDTVLRVLR